MILKNLILMLPESILAALIKTIRTNLDKETAEYIDKNGLYHFTRDLETANKIIESGKINPTKSVFVSYGIPGTFMFAGIPDLDNYFKNLSAGAWNNLLLHPDQILYAVKVNAKERDLNDYKMRLQDGAIIAEGGCILKPDQAEVKELVIDYIPNKDGKKVLALRERTKEEIERETDFVMMGDCPVAIPGRKFHSYIPSKECMEAIKQERKRLGYIPMLDTVSSVAHVVNIENKDSINAVKKITVNLKKWFEEIKTNKLKALPEGKDNKFQTISNLKILSSGSYELNNLANIVNGISNGTISSTRPSLSKNYSKSIVELNRQGLQQKDLAKTFESVINSSYYQYAKQKEKNLDFSKVYNSKIHGINHSRKVAILSSAILQDSGIDFDERMVDILMTACYYHDIGRIMDFGPHAKNSVRKLKKMDLRFENGEEYTDEDRNMLYTIVEAHEGKDSDLSKIMKKYNISEEKQEVVKFYSYVLKDADALNRARISTKFYMDLNPQYLRFNESKRLINFSFDLDTICRHIPSKDLMKLEAFSERNNNFYNSLRYEQQNVDINKIEQSPQITRNPVDKDFSD